MAGLLSWEKTEIDLRMSHSDEPSGGYLNVLKIQHLTGELSSAFYVEPYVPSSASLIRRYLCSCFCTRFISSNVAFMRISACKMLPNL